MFKSDAMNKVVDAIRAIQRTFTVSGGCDCHSVQIDESRERDDWLAAVDAFGALGIVDAKAARKAEADAILDEIEAQAAKMVAEESLENWLPYAITLPRWHYAFLGNPQEITVRCGVLKVLHRPYDLRPYVTTKGYYDHVTSCKPGTKCDHTRKDLERERLKALKSQ